MPMVMWRNVPRTCGRSATGRGVAVVERPPFVWARDRRVLDFAAGSGVSAIAAAHLAELGEHARDEIEIVRLHRQREAAVGFGVLPGLGFLTLVINRHTSSCSFQRLALGFG